MAAANGLDAILKLNPVTFNWKSTASPSSTQTGFIAQDVQKVFPNFVSVGSNATVKHSDGSSEVLKDVLAVNYTGLIVPVVKAIQELKAANDDVVSETAALRAQLKAANDNEARMEQRLERLERAGKR